MRELNYATFEDTIFHRFDGLFYLQDLARMFLNSHTHGYTFSRIAESWEIDDTSVFTRFRNGERKFRELRGYFSSPDAVKNVTDSMERNLLSELPEMGQRRLKADLLRLVDEACNISDEEKAGFRKTADNEPLSVLLAEMLVCAITVAGKTKQKKAAEPTKKAGKFPPNSFLNRRNQYFVGRDDILTQIHDRFFGNGTDSLTCQTLVGMGGVGKTETALEYALRYGGEYELIWRMNAGTKESRLEAASTFVAQIIGRADVADSAVPGVFANWLENSGGWLLIYDNVDDFDALLPFLPKIGRGHILATSRLTRGYLGEKVEIEVFNEDDAVLFLQRRTKTTDMDGAKELAVRLGRLPLALEQAGAYISETLDADVKQYIWMLNRYGLKVLEHTDHKLPVTATLKISLDKIGLESARQFLYLYAHSLPESIDDFFEDYEYFPSPLSEYAGDLLKRHELIRELTRYSLVKIDDKRITVIHPLLREVICTEEHSDNEWLEKCIRFYLEKSNLRQELTAQDVFIQSGLSGNSEEDLVNWLIEEGSGKWACYLGDDVTGQKYRLADRFDWLCFAHSIHGMIRSFFMRMYPDADWNSKTPHLSIDFERIEGTNPIDYINGVWDDNLSGFYKYMQQDAGMTEFMAEFIKSGEW